MRKYLVFGVVMAMCLAPALARAEESTMDSVEKDIDAAWNKVNSYTANMTMEGNIPMGPMTVKSSGSGSVAYKIIDGKPRFRMEMVNKLGGNIPMTGGGMEQKVLSVFNGEVIYSEVEAMGMKKYMKSTPKTDDTRNPAGGKKLLESIRKRGDVKLLPDQKVNGVDAYVFEVTPNAASASDGPVKPSKINFFVAKESGIQVRAEFFDSAGAPLMTTNFTDIKVNPELDSKQFEYTPPPGAEVTDMGDGSWRKKPTL